MFSKSLENQKDKGWDNPLEETTAFGDQAKGGREPWLSLLALVCLITEKLSRRCPSESLLSIYSMCLVCSSKQELLKSIVCFPKGKSSWESGESFYLPWGGTTWFLLLHVSPASGAQEEGMKLSQFWSWGWGGERRRILKFWVQPTQGEIDLLVEDDGTLSQCGGPPPPSFSFPLEHFFTH